jgi:acyl-CoA dehydrogenase
MAQQVIDWAIQAHGAAGICDDFGLAYAFAGARTLRIADGPDEVHRNQIAKLELAEHD